MNRLAHERSPYLLQHAGNPVDWYPWGDEAFERARREDKPIFLSVGYSTCHWCHVMEHESFESPTIAEIINREFVPIKVDREERPDVDRVYMTFVQGTTGAGGWPMSVFLTPSLQPFFGGTYFPPEARWGRPGFVDIVREIARVWRSDRARLESSAASVTEQLRGSVHASATDRVPTADALPRIVELFKSTFDAGNGGFGDQPKFPRPSELMFLLREHARTGDPDALSMVLATLRGLALGGVRDHLGGGFHRYSVDAAWRVPHFEKMLYDQAQIVLACVEAAQASGDAFYMEVAEDTLRYVMREMTDAEGGFHSAEDADSVPPDLAADAVTHKSEGAFYLWTAREIDELIGPDAGLVKARFGIEANGNAPVDPQQEFVGKNLLYAAKSLKELATQFDKSESEVRDILGRARLALFRARSTRPRPHLDDKVLTAWNGLMIGAFARTARVLRALGAEGQTTGQPFLDAASEAAAFLRRRMWDGETRTLLRRYREGDAGIEAYAEDYAYLIFGILELFQADPQRHWLEWAIALQRRQDELFWDEDHGGWFSTTGRDTTVLVRMKEDYDGAEPTASSVAVVNLLTLSHLVQDGVWASRVDATLRLFGERLEQIGRAVPMMAAALSAYHAGPRQVVIADGAGADALARRVAVRYRPFTLALRLDADQREALASLAPWLSAMHPVEGRAAAYVCEHFTCAPPVVTPAQLDAALSDN